MQQSNGHGRALTVLGVLLIVAGIGAIAVGVMFAMNGAGLLGATPEDLAGPALLSWLLPLVGGSALQLGVFAALLGMVVNGVHESLVEHLRGSRKQA